MADDLIFDGHDFDDLSRQLRSAADRYEMEITPTMGLIGKEVETAAKAAAGQRSARVAGTIKSHTIPGAAVVEAGNASMPLAELWQRGNKGSKNKGSFKHPVFAKKGTPRSEWKWVEQPMFRYLTEALRVTRPARTRTLETAWERILKRIEEGR